MTLGSSGDGFSALYYTSLVLANGCRSKNVTRFVLGIVSTANQNVKANQIEVCVEPTCSRCISVERLVGVQLHLIGR